MRVTLDIPDDLPVISVVGGIVKLAADHRCTVDARLTADGPNYRFVPKASSVTRLRPSTPDPLPPAA